MIVYQIWYETEVGPIFSTKEKAIDWIEEDGNIYDPNDPYGYPDIREFILDDKHQRLMDI